MTFVKTEVVLETYHFRKRNNFNIYKLYMLMLNVTFANVIQNFHNFNINRLLRMTLSVFNFNINKMIHVVNVKVTKKIVFAKDPFSESL